MPKQERPPTNEIGVGLSGIGAWSSIADINEIVPELAWPKSVPTYSLMRRDAQIAALEEAVLLPVLARRWRLNPNGADPRVVEFFSQDLAVQVVGSKDKINRPRARGRFRLRDHLRQAMTYRAYGHAFFEQVVALDDQDQLYHLKKLAPRWQSSIQEILTESDGGLKYIKQYVGPPQTPNPLIVGYTSLATPIPVERLVAYINRQEGDWFGHSTLRPLYKHWLLKDRLLRVDAIKHERNGMGVPMVEAPIGATKAQLIQAQELTSRYRAGESAGGTLPAGFKLRLVGVEGSLPNTLDSLKYHDEQMSRLYLAMFMQLGSTHTGSRALGKTFSDFFSLSIDAVCEDICSIFNEHVIEDIVDWNWGPDEPAPLLAWDNTAEKEMDLSDFVDLVNAGAISLTDEDEEWLRADWGMPDRDGPRTVVPKETPDGQPVPEPTPPPSPDAPPQQGDQQQQQQSNKADNKVLNSTALSLVGEQGPELVNLPEGSTIERPQNAAQRQPTEVEKQAGTDFSAIERSIADATVYLVGQWNATVRPAQIESLAQQIIDSGNDPVALSAITAPVLGNDTLSTELQRVVSQASALAVAEAATQGVTLAALSPGDFADDLNQRSTAMATVMSRSISEAAARKALTNMGPDVSASDLAQTVREHLNSLTDTYLNDTLGATVHTAHNDARFATLDQGEVQEWYASELPDTPTICTPCRQINNTPYKTIEAARKDYPGGFYKLCKGGSKCHGTLVCVFKTEEGNSEQ